VTSVTAAKGLPQNVTHYSRCINSTASDDWKTICRKLFSPGKFRQITWFYFTFLKTRASKTSLLRAILGHAGSFSVWKSTFGPPCSCLYRRGFPGSFLFADRLNTEIASTNVFGLHSFFLDDSRRMAASTCFDMNFNNFYKLYFIKCLCWWVCWTRDILLRGNQTKVIFVTLFLTVREPSDAFYDSL